MTPPTAASRCRPQQAQVQAPVVEAAVAVKAPVPGSARATGVVAREEAAAMGSAQGPARPRVRVMDLAPERRHRRRQRRSHRRRKPRRALPT